MLAESAATDRQSNLMARNRIRLAWTLLVWLGFAFAMGELCGAGFFQESLDEFADLPGLGWLGSVPSLVLVVGTVLLPLVLILHWQGGTAALARKLTPAGRALERNAAGLAWF